MKLPDGYTPRKLKPGEKPPQFVIVSFDGVGWHAKWQHWFQVGQQVPFRFTGFLSGTYLLSDQTGKTYDGPRHKPGASDINWNSAADLPTQIADLNKAKELGNEIGTHFNGHFCGKDGGGEWTEAEWGQELDQFFSLLKNYQQNNGISDQLNVTAADILGERTPCLELKPENLYPAMLKRGMIYDSSLTARGISWPKRSPKFGIWNISMAEFPIHGTLPDTSPVDPAKRKNRIQITMDYNFWVSQNGGVRGTPEQSAAASQQVLETYRDMYQATFNGNRAPLILGNHFNDWNNGAYSKAITDFVLETCGKPETQCVPFQDLVAWMHVQDPERLAQLQAQNPELGVAGGR